MASGIVEPSSQGSEEEQQGQAPRSGERSKLVQRLLDAGPNLPAFLSDLLTAQAVTVAGTEAAGFVIERGDKQFGLRPIAHIRPDESDAQTRAAAVQAFQDIIRPCVAQGKDGALEVGPANMDNEAQYCLVTLLRAETEIVAVSAVIARCRNTDLARQRLMSMQLVAGYFELFNLRRQTDASRAIASSHQRVLQLSRAVADADGFLSAAMNLCNELATASGATRVSLGWLKGRVIKVRALSHTEEFDKKQELIVQLERAMEECYDQEMPVLHDPAGKSSDAVTRQAAVLSRGQGGNIVLSLPLRRHADIEGVITLEFLPNVQLSPKVMEDLSLAVDLLAPQLYDRFENDRWLITKVGVSARHVMEEALGPKYWIAKSITLGVILLLLFLTNFFNLPVLLHMPWADIRPTYRVTAPFSFAAIDKRSLCAPFDGFIDEVYKKPGDPVKKGDKLFSLDTNDLQLKKLKATSEALSHHREADKYAADNTKIADRNVALAQEQMSLAEAQLYDWQIQHAIIVAPMDGEVLKGDLEDKKGVQVKQGDELMQVAQKDRLRAELTVNERDIQELQEGQHGKLATTSLPTAKFPFTVERIIPLGQAKEASNVFTVYGTVDSKDLSASWRPGMAGEARVDVGRCTYAWWWTHRLIDFIRLKTWL